MLKIREINGCRSSSEFLLLHIDDFSIVLCRQNEEQVFENQQCLFFILAAFN